MNPSTVAGPGATAPHPRTAPAEETVFHPGARHAGTRGGQVPPEERGSTTLSDRVIEAMAAHIIAEVDQVGGAARRVFGVTAGSEHAEQQPRVTAEVHGSVCALRARLSVCYPAPVAQVTEEVRQHLIDRIAVLADVRVRTVDITVTALYRPAVRREVR
ncbi:Asp23/Gls24 family envelope stress response protein [Saccharopolyspora sp. ASAGF58]|uniref:Asp23/Gls24 family envelope stress response protein n=1 Tax=Saccharopolyspora sp. ASAGF58 TaxID=2719023 RepID=UPI00143FC5FF|nr:Asp23/Gls24 family envelope stress response protein [Saccharopolyspora sp. ASAGF58]QIZ38093.1 Asp23/Gls24 family envelope stress response protein [Saccharopolyspora sp. ASAGF58]QIZ38642.1 Asp23/Gls24 family envelope stress response protein [Saccharopolyspora sp. ASAGF58]